MQSSNSEFNARNDDPSKAPDYAFVIAGWPTVYTIARNDYTLAGDLANFTSVRSWADFPAGSSGKVKARPEEGKMTIGQMDLSVLDRVENGVRAISDLLSRQAYLEGTVPGTKTFLSSSISKSAVNITVNSVSGLAAGGVIHIGLECIRIGTISGTTLVNCTRGYLLSSATAHASGVNVYGFLPNYYRREAFIYKGYRQLPFDKWLRAYSGVITGAQKSGPKVSFAIMTTSWETYADGKKVCIDFRRVLPSVEGKLTKDVLTNDFADIDLNIPSYGTQLSNGHYVLAVGGELMAITGVTSWVP